MLAHTTQLGVRHPRRNTLFASVRANADLSSHNSGHPGSLLANGLVNEPRLMGAEARGRRLRGTLANTEHQAPDVKLSRCHITRRAPSRGC